jgi:DNA mismatch repair ATPase MutS
VQQLGPAAAADARGDRADADGADAGAAASQAVLGALPEPVVVCLGVLLRYLQDFGLEGSLAFPARYAAFEPAAAARRLRLDHATLRNLEVLQNERGGNEGRGSLLWLLNRTSTPAGACRPSGGGGGGEGRGLPPPLSLPSLPSSSPSLRRRRRRCDVALLVLSLFGLELCPS